MRTTGLNESCLMQKTESHLQIQFVIRGAAPDFTLTK